MKLKDLIAEYRQENNISQREFSRRCELSNSLISILEKGYNPQTGKPMSPDLDTYARIARGMGLTLQELFEQLGSDASVVLYPISSREEDGHTVTTFPSPAQAVKDHDRLEKLHQDPKLGILFDRAAKIRPEDVDILIQMADRMEKAIYGDD